MTLYRYVKKIPAPKKTKNSGRFNPRIMSLLLVFLGILFLTNAVYPIVSYQLLVSPRFSTSFVSPASEAVGVLGTEIELLDLTKASNWFPGSEAIFSLEETYSYLLSIPKLKIEDAVVVIGGEDLKKSLIQHPGTAAPGRFGNTVIFGHSVLPQFFNPKSYITIFSTLPILKSGDEIIVNHNNVEYKYQVEQMVEVSPNDVSILAQRYDDSYLTLITCVPPGTYLKRLVVRARLLKI